MANSQKSRRWYLLLVLPYVALLLPGLYARMRPEMHGVPFFYWYQMSWIVLTALLTGIVYFKVRTPKSRD
jgi:uncharacterized membrane protein YhdT